MEETIRDPNKCLEPVVLACVPKCHTIPSRKEFHFICFKVNTELACVDIKLSADMFVSPVRSLVCGWHDHRQDMGYLQVPSRASSVVPSAPR
jgi:hypothetical protein